MVRFGLPSDCPRLVHGLAADVVGALELRLAHVARRQRPDLVDDVHQHLGAVGGQALAGDGVLGENLLAGVDRLHELPGVTDAAEALGAAHHDRLEVLGRHDGADARATGGAVEVVDDGGVEVPLLGRASDAGDADLRILVLLADQLVRLPDRLAPERLGALEGGHVVLDVQVDGGLGLALEDDHVPAGELELGPEVAARVRAGDGAGQRALADAGVATARRGHGAGQGAGGHDELVVGAERVDLGVDLVDEVARGEPALPEVVVRPLHLEGFFGDRARAQVHPQYFLGPAHDSSPARMRWSVRVAALRRRPCPAGQPGSGRCPSSPPRRASCPGPSRSRRRR